MGLWKRTDSNFWWYSFVLPGRPRISVSTKTADRKLAMILYQRARAEYFEKANFKKPSKITINKLLDWCLEHHWNQSEYSDQWGYRLKPIREFFGLMQAESLRVEEILKYRNQRLKGGLKKSSVNRDLTWLRAAYNYAIDNNMLQSNPLEKIKFFDETENKRERFLSQKEKDHLLTEANGILKHLVFFALKTGMRQGEILSLKWNDIDHQRGFMRVISWKGKKTTVRYVPIFDQVYDLLEAFPKHGEYVFSHPDGRPLSRMGVVHSSYMRLVDRIGIKNFVFHDLRHTFASDFLSKGGTLPELAKIMGHSATTMTERYGHLSKEHLVGAIRILSREKCYSSAPEKRERKNGKKCYDFATVGRKKPHVSQENVHNQLTSR